MPGTHSHSRSGGQIEALRSGVVVPIYVGSHEHVLCVLAALRAASGPAFLLFTPANGFEDEAIRDLLATGSDPPVELTKTGSVLLAGRVYLTPSQAWLDIDGEGRVLHRSPASQGAPDTASAEARFLHALRSLAASGARHLVALVVTEGDEPVGLDAMRAAGMRVSVMRDVSAGAIAAALRAPESGHAGLLQNGVDDGVGLWRVQKSRSSLLDICGQLLPDIVDRLFGRQLRIWVVGCGTGVQAYVLATLALRACRQADQGDPPLIFASDTDVAAIRQARVGVYDAGAFLSVMPNADAFLEAEGKGWHVPTEVREAVFFTVLDPLREAGFPKLDLVLNFSNLAGLAHEPRLRMLKAIHAALQPDGVLITDGLITDELAGSGLAAIPSMPRVYRRGKVETSSEPGGHATVTDVTLLLKHLASSAAMDAFAPPSLVVDAAGWVIGAVGPVERFANFPDGTPGGWLLQVVAPWLRQALGLAVAEARVSGEAVSVQTTDLAGSPLVLEVRAVRRPHELLLIGFRENGEQGAGARSQGLAQSAVMAGQQMEIEALHRELESMRAELLKTRLQAELFQEEGMALQEELIATRDDLSARNLLLAERHANLQATSQSHRDAALELQSILNASGIATVFLDVNLNIRFFSTSPRLPFRIMAQDVGRPLADMAPTISDPDLLDEIRIVLAMLEPSSRELQESEDAWLMRRIHPVLENDQATGVVITYADISEAKAATLQAQGKQSLTGDLVRALRWPLVVLDTSLQVLFANEPFRAAFGPTDDNALRLLVGPALRAAPTIAAFLTSRDAAAEKMDDCVIQVALPGLGLRTLRVGASRLPPARTLLSVEDITERVQLTGALENARILAEGAARERSRLLIAAARDLSQLLGEFQAVGERMEGDSDVDFQDMTAILDALSDGAQLDLGLLQPSFTVFSIGGLLEEVEKDFAAVARARNVQWRVVSCVRPVLSDPGLIRQLLHHQIGVLIRHMPHGRLLVGCRRRGDRLRLEIWTEGLRLPSPLLHAAIEQLRQPSADEADVLRFGLGLGVARRLGELLGHPLRIETRRNGEAIILMDLPADLAAITSGPASEAQRPILIVEKDPEFASSLRLLLEEDGYGTMVAGNGAQALGLALEHPPALVVASHGPPSGIDGLDLMRRIGEAHASRPPAAIFLLGEMVAPALQDIVASNFEYASRNLEPRELLDRVRRRLPRPHSTTVLPDGARHGRVFIVEDDAELRHGMAESLRRLGWSVEIFASAQEFLETDTPERSGCVLVDWGMTGTEGMSLLNVLRPQADRLPVIMMAGQGDIRLAVTAVSAGAVDFLKKPIENDMLLRSLERATTMVAEGARQQASRTEHAARLASLTPRQREILDRIVAGAPNKIIAADLSLSQRTVENHRATLMAKLGARSLPELIRIVMGAP